MAIDVLGQIKPLLSFRSEDDFYYLQIIQRKKENPDIGSNSRIIKNYYIHNVGYLEKKYKEIKILCDTFNARAMLRLNRRSFKSVAFKTLQNVSNYVVSENYLYTRKSYDKACGDGNSETNKTWIIDIDREIDDLFLDEITKIINNSSPQGDKFIILLPTLNGFHLVVKPFDSRFFKEKHPDIEIHKDNPINLYIP